MGTTNLPSFEKIVVPRGWTGERDICVCVDSFGEVDDYFGEALARVDAGYDRLEKSLDGILILTGNAGSFTGHIIQRIDILQRHFLEWPYPEAYRERLLGDLAYCQFAAVEYFRIMPGYLNRGDFNWLFPLVRLSDHLTPTASGLSKGTKSSCKVSGINDCPRHPSLFE